MAIKKGINFGTIKDPIEVDWDSYLIHKCIYNKDDVKKVFDEVVSPNVSDLCSSYYSRFNLRESFRACLKAIDRQDIQNVLNLLMAFRLMMIDSKGRHLIDIGDECAKHIFQNIIFNMNHYYNTALLNKICKTAIIDAYGIPVAFYYMGSEYDNDNLPREIAYDEQLLYMTDKAKQIAKKERDRKKVKVLKEQEITQ